MIKTNFEMRELLNLAVPLIFSNLINISSSLVGMYFISQVSPNTLAAGAIITSTYGLIVMMVISILYSVSIIVAKMHGSNANETIGSVVFSGIFVTLIIGIPLTILLLHIEIIFDTLKQPHEISILAGEYFQALAIGFIPSLIGAVYTQFFMGISQPRVILSFTILGAIVNSALSYICIFGYSFIPALGVLGAGLACSITAYTLLITTILYVLYSSRFKSYNIFNYQRITLKYIPTILKIGIPISIQYSAELLAFSALTFLMGILGADALCAQQIALQCSMIGIMIVMAISQSGSILISQSLNENKIHRTLAIANSALLLGTSFMLIIGAIYWFFPIKLISLYLDVKNTALTNTVYLTKIILSIAAFTQIFDGGRNIAAGLLRGFGDTKSSMLTGITSCWVIGIPTSICFGFLLHLGAPGIRLGMMIGIFIGCINLVLRFYSPKKHLSNTLIYEK